MSIAQEWTTSQMMWKIRKLELDSAYQNTRIGVLEALKSSTAGVTLPSSGSVNYSLAGSITADTIGANTTPSAGYRYWVKINIPYNCTLHGLSFLVGTVGGTDSLYMEFYKADSTLAARTTKAICGTAKQIQSCSFASNYTAVAGIYYIALQSKGNTMRFRAHSVTGSKFVAGSATGSFGVAAAFSPGGTYTAAKAPFCATW